MKKIFAIALALVMVLSMASAFAAFCVNPDWSCPADVCYTGTGKVEVVPYVKGNGCGTSNSWAVSTCAGAVNGDKVYAALKVTVDADANLDWWDKATLTIETKGVQNLKIGAVPCPTGAKYEFAAGDVAKFIKAVKDNDGELKAGEYYLYADASNWYAVKAADFEAGAATLFSADVNEASKVKFCATLKSKMADLTNVKVGDYIVYYMGDHINVQNGKTGDDYKSANFFLNADKKIEYVTYVVGSTTYTFNYDDGANFLSTDAAGVAKGYACAPFNWLKTVMNNFKFDFRTTCYTEKAFKANFGWDAKAESCFSWSSNVQSVVDAECVVAIPKTGDASVLAWLF